MKNMPPKIKYSESTDKTLDTTLSMLSPSTRCLECTCGDITVEELRIKATSLRKKLSVVSGRNVVLSGLSPYKLIEALVALDGYVSAMLLLPDGVDCELQRELIENANCDYAINNNHEITPLKTGLTDSPHLTHPTQWMLATSGTTGVPKIITHSFSSLTSTLKRDPNRGSLYTWGLMYDPCRFAGLQVVLQSIIGGSCLALPISSSFDDQINTLLDKRVNALSATPTLWRKMLMEGRILNAPLKQITLGGEITDQFLLDVLRRQFQQARIVHIYASTEVGAAFAVQDGRSGFPLSWIGSGNAPAQLRVDHKDQLLIKPVELPTGDEISSRLDVDGYIDTQDLVQIKGDRVYFLGRVSGAINVGGNKVHPEEIENIIREIPDVLDVCVYAKSSSIVGQLVAAEIVATKECDSKILRQQVQQHCRSMLESWQCPAFVTIVSSLQETTAGKRKR